MSPVAEREALVARLRWEGSTVFPRKIQREWERFLNRIAGPDQFRLPLPDQSNGN